MDSGAEEPSAWRLQANAWLAMELSEPGAMNTDAFPLRANGPIAAGM